MTIAEASIVAAHLKVKLDFFSSFHILFHLQKHTERQKMVWGGEVFNYVLTVSRDRISFALLLSIIGLENSRVSLDHTNSKLK